MTSTADTVPPVPETVGRPHNLVTPGWPVRLFTPVPQVSGLLMGRVAARSPDFAPNDAAGGQRVLIGSAAGETAQSVTVRARGELLERVHNVVAGREAERGRVPGALMGRFDRLRRTGRPALDPLAWPELAGYPGLREAEMLWVPGESLTGGGQVLVPAWAVYLAHRSSLGSVALPSPGSTGLAAHATHAAAGVHGLLEVLERDLIARTWYDYAPRFELTGRPPLSQPLREALDALTLASTFLLLPGPRGSACILCCLHSPEQRRQSFGARAVGDVTDGPAVAAAARAAAHEALMVRWSMETPAAGAVADWLATERNPWISGPVAHALHAFHRQNGLGRLMSCAGRMHWPDPDRRMVPRPVQAQTLADHTERDVIGVDTTVANLASTGAVVVRTVAPGARRLPVTERLSTGTRGPGIPPHPLG
ncbi:YcaO-like family protein [Nocardiopsis ansamitocini]|uniref:YcaO domain-containing protein n=1 Tax=Nocardiopsis ansamitocini TaxID=1670832 RepID=A0A9W6P6F7_9ACTN|nr:YcaO-like family protein [Nocardiopsis ansamitocini]GLU47873.1 hypothetical protein Nans01_22240 [Nocardiopsis ansamitocini]